MQRENNSKGTSADPCGSNVKGLEVEDNLSFFLLFATCLSDGTKTNPGHIRNTIPIRQRVSQCKVRSIVSKAADRLRSVKAVTRPLSKEMAILFSTFRKTPQLSEI